MRNPRDIIKKPLISEKTMRMLEENKYTFRVDPRANKIEIKNAIAELFSVNVVEVTTMNVKGKEKRMGRYVGRTTNWKKAIVTLQDGDKIEIFEGV